MYYFPYTYLLVLLMLNIAGCSQSHKLVHMIHGGVSPSSYSSDLEYAIYLRDRYFEKCIFSDDLSIADYLAVLDNNDTSDDYLIVLSLGGLSPLSSITTLDARYESELNHHYKVEYIRRYINNEVAVAEWLVNQCRNDMSFSKRYHQYVTWTRPFSSYKGLACFNINRVVHSGKILEKYLRTAETTNQKKYYSCWLMYLLHITSRDDLINEDLAKEPLVVFNKWYPWLQENLDGFVTVPGEYRWKFEEDENAWSADPDRNYLPYPILPWYPWHSSITLSVKDEKLSSGPTLRERLYQR